MFQQTSNLDDIGSSSEEDTVEGEEELFSVPEERKRKSDTVCLSLPRKDLAKVTAVTAKRHKVGTRPQADILANILTAGGVDLSDVACSRSTIQRAGIKAIEETAEEVKNKFMSEIRDSGRSLIIYVDGKAIEETSVSGDKEVKKRVAVMAKNSSMEKEQVLGVVIAKSNSGLHMFEAIVPLLEDWNLISHILGFCFDTTADNTGKHKGLIVRLEKWLGVSIWWCACPHHHYEIHIKKVARLVYGESSSPEEQIYKKNSKKLEESQ